ncbi:sodium transporter [candidate division GN15 bacterium]|nr:sodium transporter [candidate division GN15 bacterium]
MIDLLIVLAFVAYSIGNGFRNRSKASQNLVEYFLAGRTIKGWRAGVSLAATQFAADTPLLVVGLIATGGIFMLWRLWIYGFGFLIIGFLLGHAWRRSGVITDAELTEIRYSGPGVVALRGLKAIYYGTIMNCTIMAMVLIAACRISEVFLLWHEWLPAGLYGWVHDLVSWVGVSIASGATGLDPWTATANNLISIIVILIFTALYSTTGGLRAVIATDTVQFAVAMIGTLIYAIIVMVQAGGFGEIVDSLVDLYGKVDTTRILSFSPTTGEALLPFLIIVSLQWLFERNSDGTGYFAQRMMSSQSDGQARLAAVVFTWLQIFLRSLVWLVIGVGLLIVYPFTQDAAMSPDFAAGREILFATGIKDLLPVGVKGLVLTGMLAALASTIDTHLTWGAGYWANDLYLRIINRAWLKREPARRELVMVARLSNVVLLIIALTIMANLGSIQTAWYISLLFGAGTGGVLLLRWVWERANLYSEIAAIGVSLVLAPIILFTTDAEWLRLLLMASISTVVVIIVTLATRPTESTVLDSFYKTTQPPGFWRATATRLGLEANRSTTSLLRGIYLAATSSLSIYLLLYGCSRLLFLQPDQSIAWAIGAVILGLASIAFWWRPLKRAVQENDEGMV